MRTRIAATVLTAVALLALTACNPGDDKAGHSPGGPAATPTASTDYKAIARALGIVPAPVGAKRTELLAALRGINPALVAKPDKAISNARNQCSTLDGAGDPNGLSAAERFGGDNTHPLTAIQGVAIDVALREKLCPAN